jgi:RNA polymerase-binding transcription factor DksA
MRWAETSFSKRLTSTEGEAMAHINDLTKHARRKQLIEHRQAARGLLDKWREVGERLPHSIWREVGEPFDDSELVTDLEISAQIRAAKHRLTESDKALVRLEMGTYGVCGVCGAGISLDRLDALPLTGSCRQCA